MKTAPAEDTALSTQVTLQGQSFCVELVTRMPTPALWVGADGLIVHANQAAAEALAADLVGQPLEAAIANRRLAAGITEAMTTGQARQMEMALGEGHAATANLVPMEDLGVLVFLHTSEHLQELEEFRSQVVAVISHDLKNPLTVAIGFVEFLVENGGLSSEAETCVHGIRSSLVKMRRLIENVLDLTQLDTSPRLADVSAQHTEPSPLIEGAIAELQPLAQAREQSLSAILPPELPDVRIDAERLRQAIRNLVDNAIRYTQIGGAVDISADLLPGKLMIKVRDNGPGILAAKQGRLFEKFYRVGSRHTIGKEGSGLGLAIAHKIVKDAGGDIGVVSEEGRGSTFWFWLPTA